MECIFCKISGREIPSNVVYEDDEVFAFLDIHPVNYGHTLVIPRHHAENILESSAEDSCAVVKALPRIAAAVVAATGAHGFNVHINTGAAAGQVVMHTHWHIIPRFESGEVPHWPHKEISPDVAAELAVKIKESLS